MSDDTYRTRLMSARERLGLSRRDMADRLMTSRKTYDQWEAGSRRTPGVAVVAAEMFARSPAPAETGANLPGTLSRRDRDICLRLIAGESPKKVAEAFGLTRQRIVQLAQDAGLSLPNSRASVRARHLAEAIARAKATAETQRTEEERQAELRRLVEAGLSIREAGRLLGYAPSRSKWIGRKMGLGAITQYGRWGGAARKAASDKPGEPQ